MKKGFYYGKKDSAKEAMKEAENDRKAKVKKMIDKATIVIIFLLFVVPMPKKVENTETVKYESLLYNVIKYDEVVAEGHHTGFAIEFCGFTVYDKSTYKD